MLGGKSLLNSEALEQVEQRICGCSICGGVRGQVGQGPGKPGVVDGSPAYGRGLRLDDL